MTSTVEKQPWFLRVDNEFDAFCKKVDDKLSKHQQQLKACKKRNELEFKLAQEIKHKEELTQKLLDLSRKGDDLDRLCTAMETHLTIADSDKTRLDNAKEAYQLAKELTGIRLDFSAPPNVAKGYIKNEARRVLQPFEMEADAGPLWALVRAASDPTWPAPRP